MLTEIDQLHTLGKTAADDLRGRSRHQHLTTGAHCHQSGRPVERRSEVVPRPMLRWTGMDRHPRSQR